MIQIEKKTALAGAGASAVTLAYGVFVAPRGTTRRRVAIGFGLVGAAAAALAWRAADAQEKAITRNPEVMNGHFITQGRASAVTGGLADVDYLRELMGVPEHLPRRGGRHGHHLR